MPIIIRALNDGGATINGQDLRIPVNLIQNDYFIIEGINAHNSSASVVQLSNSHNNTIRRVCAWDAFDNDTGKANNMVYSLYLSTCNLLEDCAGWGKGRKIYQPYKSNNNTFRRCWGRWEHCSNYGAMMTYSMGYLSNNLTFENCIGTWSSDAWMVAHPPHDGASIGIFSIDRLIDNPSAPDTDWSLLKSNTKMLGCLAYIQPQDVFTATQLIYIRFTENFTIKDTISHVPKHYASPSPAVPLRTFLLQFNQPLFKGIPEGLIAENIWGIGGQIYYSHNWQVTKKEIIPCYKYGTNEKLWPWPMNERIKNAMTQSGRNTADVTLTVETLLGVISGSCRYTQTLRPTQPTTSCNPPAR